MEKINYIDEGDGKGDEEALLKEGEEDTGEMSGISRDDDGKSKLDGIKEELNELQRRVELIEKKVRTNDMIRHLNCQHYWFSKMLLSFK